MVALSAPKIQDWVILALFRSLSNKYGEFITKQKYIFFRHNMYLQGISFFSIVISRLVVAHGHKCVTVVATGSGLDPYAIK